MAAYFTTSDNRGHVFTVNPKIVRSHTGKGWVIAAYCDDATLYGGLYTHVVGVAYENTEGRHGWRRKKDAIREMNIAVQDKILRYESRV